MALRLVALCLLMSAAPSATAAPAPPQPACSRIVLVQGCGRARCTVVLASGTVMRVHRAGAKSGLYGCYHLPVPGRRKTTPPRN